MVLVEPRPQKCASIITLSGGAVPLLYPACIRARLNSTAHSWGLYQQQATVRLYSVSDPSCSWALRYPVIELMVPPA